MPARVSHSDSGAKFRLSFDLNAQGRRTATSGGWRFPDVPILGASRQCSSAETATKLRNAAEGGAQRGPARYALLRATAAPETRDEASALCDFRDRAEGGDDSSPNNHRRSPNRIATGESGHTQKTVTFERNERSRSAGIAGRVQTEPVVTRSRNTHYGD